jgi:hypothetical protein
MQITQNCLKNIFYFFILLRYHIHIAQPPFIGEGSILKQILWNTWPHGRQVEAPLESAV